VLELNFEGNRERTKVPHPPIVPRLGKYVISMYVVLLSCTECVLHAFGQSRSLSFPLGKFPHERSLSLSEVTVPSAGRQFATAPSGGRRVARENEERESVCVCEKESASASVGVGVCGDLARAREIVRSSSEWDRRGGI